MSQRIGITQRVEVVAAYGERRDSLDQRWFVLFEQLGLVPVPIPNSLMDVADWCRAMALDGIVLSGGNDLAHLPGGHNVAPERDVSEGALLDYARVECLPVLGVCRGMQAINHYLGGALVPVTGHSGSRHGVQVTDSARVFTDYSGQTVNSYHNWELPADGLGTGLIREVITPEGGVEGYRHDTLPWLGIMWHPEREVPFNQRDFHLIATLFRS